jgi:PAS domain S-box-containing protein
MTRQLSLAKFVAATLVTVTTLLLGAFGAAAYRAEKARLRIELDGLVQAQARQAAVALAVPVWNIDRPAIDKLLDAMTQPESMYGISVTAAGETYGRIRDARRKLVPWNGRGAPAGLIVHERPIRFGGNEIGIVRLYASDEVVAQMMRELTAKIVGGIVLVDILIIVSVYLVLWRSVLRPLTAIEHYAGAVSAGVERPVAVPSTAGSAPELESLRSSLESMVNLLALREARFRSIFESANDAIFIVDVESGVPLDVNARVFDIFGYTREEAVLDPTVLSAGTPPYTQADFIAQIRSLQPGDRRIMEWHARHKDGHLFWVEISFRAAMIGNALCVVSVVRDIDARKAMEEKLRRSETMSAMGNIVAGVAHEVRNPLFGIAATVDAFEAEFGAGGDVGEYLATLRNDVSRLGRLMNDLLDYGRPQQSERRLQSIRPIVAEALRVCAAQAKEKRIELRAEISPDLPNVSVDADRMLQVFRNVVENAIDFSAAGEPVLLRVSQDGEAAPALVFTIADRGPGFRAEDLPHLFEPFFTRRAGGSGLGLAIVQKIVGEHGGTIAAHNAPGGGGVVEIRLPVTSSPSRTGSPQSG